MTRGRTTLPGVLVAMLALGACEVQQEQPARAPDVDVDVREGQLPEYDVDTGDVDIGRDTVTVPEVQIEEPDQTRTDGTR